MDFSINQKPLTNQQFMLLDTCITQSRTSLFYADEQEHNQFNNNQFDDIIGETRKFKIEIQQKFNQCEHNRKYVFPKDVCFSQDQIDEQEDNLLKSLQKTKFYRLAEQNNYHMQAIQRLKKSRSTSTVGLFKQALIMQKQQSKRVSKSRVKQFKQKQPNPIPKPSQKLKKIIRDKQNNLNFQNLRQQKQSFARCSVSKSKGKGTSNIKSQRPKKVNIPKINLSDRNQPQTVKCFRDLAKLDHRR